MQGLTQTPRGMQSPEIRRNAGEQDGVADAVCLVEDALKRMN